MFLMSGIVTTARLTHATPAAMYAHVFSRAWECDDAYVFTISHVRNLRH